MLNDEVFTEPEKHFSQGESISGDGIFRHANIDIPFNRSSLQMPPRGLISTELWVAILQYRQEKKLLSKKIQRNRCVIENVFARLKATFRMLHFNWKYRKTIYKRLYLLCCAPFNYGCIHGHWDWPRDKHWFNSDARTKWEREWNQKSNEPIFDDECGMEYDYMHREGDDFVEEFNVVEAQLTLF